MKPENLGKKFVEVNRALAWAETPEAWNPAIQKMDAFLEEIKDLLKEGKFEKSWSKLESTRILAVLLTVMAEGGQYRHESFAPNAEKESDLARRKLIEEEMLPVMAALRERAGGLIKLYLSRPVFAPLKQSIEDEIMPLVDSMDESGPDRYMGFRVIQIGNIVERLYNFKIRTNDKDLVGGKGNGGLLKAIYDFKYLRFGTSGVRGLWQRDFTEKRAKQVVQAICEYLTNKDLPPYLKGEDLSGRKIIVGYDSRLNANKVAEWVSQVALANGFKIDFANRDTPTPALVYWLTEYHKEDEVAALINLTASHNPPEWQGIKFNPRQGWPAPTNVTDFIASRINEINILGATVDEAYLDENIDAGNLKGFDPIVHYTRWLLESGDGNERISIDTGRIAKFFKGKTIVIDEMHGASRGYLSRILGQIGVKHEIIHAERDPLIPGLDYANPEEPFINGLKDAVRESGAALGLGMDTDADRFGIVDAGGVYLRPNQILPMLVRYLGVDRGLTGRIIATQTGSPLLEVLAGMMKDNEENKPEENIIPAYIDHPFYKRRVGSREDQVYKHTFMVPVGIKYIEEQRRTNRRYGGLSPLPEGWRNTILIGGEESSGLTTRGHVTDKDGIWANLLIIDMLAYYGTRATKKLKTISAIWKETVSLPGLWESFGGKEDFAHPKKHSNAGRVDVDAILEVKEAIIDYYLNTYGPGKKNQLGDLEVAFAGGVRYDLAELRLQDSSGDNRHYARVRASGTEPINRIYIESSSPETASELMEIILDRLEILTMEHISRCNSEWMIADALAFATPSTPILKAIKEVIARKHFSTGKLKDCLQAMIDGEILEKRNNVKAAQWITKLG